MVAALAQCDLLRLFDFFSYLGVVTPRKVGHMPFDLQPTLNGQLVQLGPLRTDDYEVLYAVAGDPLIWEQHPLRDRFNEEVFQQFYRDALESGGTLIVMDKKDGRVIGSSRFHGYNAEQSEVEISWTGGVAKILETVCLY